MIEFNESCTWGKVMDGGRRLYYLAPNSYTKRDFIKFGIVDNGWYYVRKDKVDDKDIVALKMYEHSSPLHIPYEEFITSRIADSIPYLVNEYIKECNKKRIAYKDGSKYLNKYYITVTPDKNIKTTLMEDGIYYSKFLEGFYQPKENSQLIRVYYHLDDLKAAL